MIFEKGVGMNRKCNSCKMVDEAKELLNGFSVALENAWLMKLNSLQEKGKIIEYMKYSTMVLDRALTTRKKDEYSMFLIIMCNYITQEDMDRFGSKADELMGNLSKSYSTMCEQCSNKSWEDFNSEFKRQFGIDTDEMNTLGGKLRRLNEIWSNFMANAHVTEFTRNRFERYENDRAIDEMEREQA